MERDKLERMLGLAGRAPSAINLQPWEVSVVSGAEKERLSRLLVKRLRERRISCGPGAQRELAPQFVARQQGLMKAILPLLSPGEDFQPFINEGSCRFYGAPTALILSIDQAFTSARLVDLGLFAGYLLLSAHALGLGTCPIGLITAFADDIREELSIREERDVVLGIAVGYPDGAAPVNRVHSDRAPLSEFVRWRG